MSTRNAGRTRKNKERSKNFTELEKRTVLELIGRHREVLRQGRSNNATNKNKQLVWSQICIEVNKRCRAECPRTPAQVKMWYENYKKKCKMRCQEPGSEEGGSNLLDGMLWTINPLAENISIKDERREMPSTAILNPEDHLPVNMSSERLDGSGLTDTESKDGLLQLPLDRLAASPAPSPPLASMAISAPSECHSGRGSVMSGAASPDSVGPLNLSHLEPRVCIHTSPSPPLLQQARCPNPYSINPRYVNDAFYNRKCATNAFRINNVDTNPNSNPNAASSNPCCSNNNNSSTSNNNNAGGIGLKQSDSVIPVNPSNFFCSNSIPTEEEKLYFNAKRQHAIWEHEAKMKIINMELKQKEEIFSLQRQLFLIELKAKMDFWEKNCNK